MQPFKLKKDFVKDYRVITFAQEVFGTPNEGITYHSGNAPYCEAYWKFYGNDSECVLHVSQNYNTDQIKLEFTENSFNSDNTISVNIKDFVPDWRKKISKFVKAISKPWQDWTEEELISDPMWIYYFWRSDRVIPEQYHSAMTMFSYENPNNYWVKRYFDEQDQNQEQEQNN